MDSQISRILATGIAEGRGPLELARLLTKTITGPFGDLGITDTLGRFIPAKRRAEMLARTEIIRAHHVATIREYRNWAVAGVKVKAEWQTTSGACDLCADLQGKIFSLNQIEGMIPYHPRCRCCALPVEVPN
jgi:SPP1 gp7 family putative phage head morphogenesis protein